MEVTPAKILSAPGSTWMRQMSRTVISISTAYRYINIDKDTDAERKVMEWNAGRRITPTVVISSSQNGTLRLTEPENEELDKALRRYGVKRAA